MQHTGREAPTPQVLLVSAIFPPAIGGSAVLLENVYRRCKCDVVVLTDLNMAAARPAGRITRVERTRLATTEWGVRSARGLIQYGRVAARIRSLSRQLGPMTSVHCGRVLPEGVAAALAQAAGGQRFACWVHGEDLATALTSRELRWLTRQTLAKAHVVFANSENSKNLALEFGVEGPRIEVVYPGVDATRFRPGIGSSRVRQRHRLRHDDVVALTLGRLQRRKGQDTAIRAVAALAGRWPRLHQLIVGDGDDLPRLLELISSLGIADRVTLVGEVTDDELPEYFAASDLFLLPNRTEPGDIEGFGIVFLEAAAAGKPVIGGASGGVIEAVDDGRTGILVDGSLESVVDALDQLVASPELRSTLGEAGRVRAVTNFTWEHAAARVSSRL
jgi:phosphatidylinositol alpha-1,6-mannosyltransferase